MYMHSAGILFVHGTSSSTSTILIPVSICNRVIYSLEYCNKINYDKKKSKQPKPKRSREYLLLKINASAQLFLYKKKRPQKKNEPSNKKKRPIKTSFVLCGLAKRRIARVKI